MAAAQMSSTTVSHAPAQILLQFLLDYPVGEKRLDSHLQFLLANLAYEHETGRLAVRGTHSECSNVLVMTIAQDRTS